jgi:hypothetical protein
MVALIDYSNLAELKRRLGPVDIDQIRLLLRVSPARRILTMLDMQDLILNSWHSRLRQAHPELNNLDLCRLMFERLDQDVETFWQNLKQLVKLDDE